MKYALPLFAAAILAGCSATPTAADPQQDFFVALSAHCGKAYAGRLASDQEADADMRGKAMIVHFRTCTADRIEIPFISRGWPRTAAGTARAPGSSPAPTAACG